MSREDFFTNIISLVIAFVFTAGILVVIGYSVYYNKKITKEANMAKQVTHVVVVGSSKGMIFPFPIDMLRYDRLTPKSENDSAKIIGTIDSRIGRSKKGREDVEVSLTKQAETRWRPTVDRWISFGWYVISHTKSAS